MSNSVLDPSLTFPTLCDTVGIDNRLRKAVSRLGYSRPTLVQSKCLPLALLEQRNLWVRAPTGTGKTLAYSLAVLQNILTRKTIHVDEPIRAIILVPTRELCAQVSKTVQELCYYCDDVVMIATLGSTTTTITNNASQQQQHELQQRQEAMLRDRPNVVVATPAGLVKQIRAGAVQLKQVETVVIDEADLVLSFGYSSDIAEIIKALPRIYQGFLLSATLSPQLESLKKMVLNAPVVVKLEHDGRTTSDTTNNGYVLKQYYLAVPKKDKNLVLYVFLKLGLLQGKGLFFVHSTDAGYRLKLFLEQFHIRSAVLNAELPFTSRINIIEQFNVGNFDYLIATDASTDVQEQNMEEDSDAAEEVEMTQRRRKQDAEYGVSRGLDFQNVSFVVNVDFPPNPRSYSHRVGRTARGGAKGVALSLVDADSTEECNALLAVQEDQPTIPLSATASDKLQGVVQTENNPDGQPSALLSPEQVQPMLLDFDLAEIEGFRYRVEDVQRAVTKIAVRETRAAELRAEILNSERLQSHFEENPADLQILQHDRIATHVSRVQEHLKHVPKYLLPQGMQVAMLNRKRRRKKSKKTTGGVRRSDNDPLQAFVCDVNLDGVQADDEDPLETEYMVEEERDVGPIKKQKTEEPKVFTSTKDGTGRSTAGRVAWKQRHRKGQFSGKKRKSDRKSKQPLGI